MINRRRLFSWALAAAVIIGLWVFTWWPGNPFWSPEPVSVLRSQGTACPPIDGRSLTLVAVGDIMMHTPVSKSALEADGSFDFRPHFQYVRPIFQNADLVMGNLETPLAGGPLTGYPSFNGPDDLVDGLKWAGFTTLTLANNHSLDKGWPGLQRTAELVRDRDIMYVGAYLSAEDRARPRIRAVSGLKVGFLGYTYGVNGPREYPRGESWRLNFIDQELMAADLAALREAGADFTIVNVHFGDEYQRKPNKRQLALVEALFEAGADLIIGHHPHVVQPGVLRHRGPDGDQAAVFSLGNFLSNQRDRYTDQGLMVTAHLSIDHRGRKSLGPLTFHQTRCIRRLVDGRPTYRVVPVYEAVKNPGAYGLSGVEAEFLARDQAEMARHLVDY